MISAAPCPMFHHFPDDSADAVQLHSPEANRTGNSVPSLPVRAFPCVLAGGNWNDASKAGVSYFNANNTLSNSNANIGARLANASFGVSENISLHTVFTLSLDRISRFLTISGLVVIVPMTSARSEVCRSLSMRRIKNKFGIVVSMDHLDISAKSSCSTRKNKSEVSRFLEERDSNLQYIHDILVDRSYVPDGYRFFHRDEHGKDRLISDLPLFPHRIIHSALALAIEDEMNAKLIPHCYGSVKGRGPHLMIRDLYDSLQEDDRIQYVLIFDIKKCFESFDKDSMKSRLREVIKDNDVLWLFDTIIDGYPLPGISIGDRLSPLLANMFLSPLDHMLVEEYHCHYLGRFVDDVYVLGYSKPWLHRIQKVAELWLGDHGLEMKGNWRIVPVDSGFTIVGFHVFRDHIFLKTSTKKRLQHRCNVLSKRLDAGIPLSKHDRHTLSSYKGCLDHCNGRNLYTKTIGAVLEKDAELQERKMSEIMASRAFRSLFCEELK